ncbi:MAG: 7TM diverse intracellular signaling domain-containing protein [Brachymonas sp.]
MLFCLALYVGLISSTLGQTDSSSASAGVGPVPVVSSPEPQLLQTPNTLLLDYRVQQASLDGIAQFFLDTDTKASIQNLVARASAGVNLFQSFRASGKHHTDARVLWIRFDAQMVDTRSRWLLEVDSIYLDDVQLFWQAAPNQWMMFKAGDRVPRAQWPLRTRVPVFELLPDSRSPGQAVTYYLRIENARSPVSLPLTVYHDSELVAQEQFKILLLGAMMGMVTLVLAAGLLIAITQRDVAFAAYVGYSLSLGFYMLTSIGLSAMYLWPNSPVLADRMNYVTAGITCALGPWFVSRIVNPVYRRNLLTSLALAQAAFAIVVTVMEAIMPSMMTYRLINLAAFSAIVVVYLLVASAWQRGDLMTRWVALSFAPVALAAIPLILRNLAIIPSSWFTQYVVLIASAIEIPCLLYALLTRNSQRRESRARALGLPTHDAFTGLPNMRTFLDALHGSITRAHRFNHAYGLMLIDLTNHAWFVKEHGQEVANKALILASTRLQDIARDVDCVTRLDNNQFVLLVEGQCSASLMTKTAARIAAAGLKPSDVLPVGSSLKFQLTCALMPTAASLATGDDANAQLGWLISQTEDARSEPFKSIRTLGF